MKAHQALSLATVVLAAMLWTPLASAAAALRAQVSSCIPVADEDPATGVRGLTAAQRGVQLQYGWVTRSAADDGDKAGALAATTRLEICRFGADGNFICPASADVNPNLDWLIFDAQSRASSGARRGLTCQGRRAGGDHTARNLPLRR
jgi:hypothetical protein